MGRRSPQTRRPGLLQDSSGFEGHLHYAGRSNPHAPVAFPRKLAEFLTRLALWLRRFFHGLLRGTFLRFGAGLIAFEALAKCVHQVDYIGTGRRFECADRLAFLLFLLPV
jgi:hypothetical protein